MPSDNNQTPPLMQVASLGLERGERRLFEAMSFSMREGMLVRLAGPNGAGKTSLLRLLTGLMEPDEGEVLYRGSPIRDLREDYTRDMCYIGHLNGVKDDLTSLENLRVSARLGGAVPTDEALLDALERVGLVEYADRLTGQMSQGQRRRVALARLFLSSDKHVWVLDEPFTALDVASVAELSRAVADHVKQGGLVIYTTHQECAIDVPESARLTIDVSAYAPRWGEEER